MKAVTVVFAINIPYLCGSYVVKGPADRRCASRMLNQLCRRTKSGIPTGRYRMPNERVIGSVLYMEVVASVHAHRVTICLCPLRARQSRSRDHVRFHYTS